jgi:hypothetical protein
MGGTITITPDAQANPITITPDTSVLSPSEKARQRFLQNMTSAQAGQKMQNPEDQPEFDAGKKAGAVSAAETTGGVLGGESVPALRGVLGTIVRMLGTGGGAAAGNAAGQFATTGTVDPGQSAKAGAIWGGTTGALEGLGAVAPELKSGLSKLFFSGKVAADGTPELSTIAKSVLHPTQMPENLIRSLVPAPPEALAAAKAQAGEATAAKLQDQMTAAETARQKFLSDRGKLETQDATEQAAAVKRQQTADRLAAAKKRFADSQAAKNAPPDTSVIPEPRAPLPSDRPGAMWSIGRETELPAAAQRGAPGAGDVLQNLNKPVIYTPKEGVGYPGPRQEANLSDLAGERRVADSETYTGPERRTFLKGVSTAYDQPTEGEKLAQQIRATRAGPINPLSEGEALQRIMKDPEAYQRYKLADRKTRDSMLVKAKMGAQ